MRGRTKEKYKVISFKETYIQLTGAYCLTNFQAQSDEYHLKFHLWFLHFIQIHETMYVHMTLEKSDAIQLIKADNWEEEVWRKKRG